MYVNINEPWDNRKQKPWQPNPHDPWDKEGAKGKAIQQPARPITIADLFPSLDRWAIGWSPILDELKTISANKPSYPPYDIIDHKDHTTLINVAVAGFTKKDLTITVKERTLTIEGKKEKEDSGTIVHNGIAGRDFKLVFALAEFYEVESATVKDGILAIKLYQNIPDEKKPKVIDIK